MATAAIQHAPHRKCHFRAAALAQALQQLLQPLCGQLLRAHPPMAGKPGAPLSACGASCLAAGGGEHPHAGRAPAGGARRRG